MKKIVLFVTVLFLFSACKNTWDSEDKQLFYQSCVEEAGWLDSPEKKKTYCDCVMDKMMTKFPNEAEAIEHLDSVIKDPDIGSCKAEVLGK